MMSRIMQTACLFVMVLLLYSCGSRGLNTELTSCVYPDSERIPAPSFICDQQLDGYPITALRSHSESDQSASEISALLLNEQIVQWSEQWANEWFEEAQVKQSARRFLLEYLHEHARVIRSRTSPKNTLWLLIGIDESLENLKAYTEAQMLSGE
jgi:hypothetical protein